MKKLLLAVVLVMCMSAWAVAADVMLKWDAVPGATGYKVYQSIDNGVTWSTGADVGNVTQTTLLAVSDSVFVMFKVSAYFAGGESIRHWSGAWYDGRKKPIDAPTGAGVR